MAGVDGEGFDPFGMDGHDPAQVVIHAIHILTVSGDLKLRQIQMVVRGSWDVVMGRLHAHFDPVKKSHGSVDFLLRRDKIHERGASIRPRNSEQLFCFFQLAFFVFARYVFPANGALP